MTTLPLDETSEKLFPAQYPGGSKGPGATSDEIFPAQRKYPSANILDAGIAATFHSREQGLRAWLDKPTYLDRQKARGYYGAEAKDIMAQTLKNYKPQSRQDSALSGELGNVPWGNGTATEFSATITDNRLNGGKPTNIPMLVRGMEPHIAALQNQPRTAEQEEIAILRAIERQKAGASLPAYNTIEEAVQAAEQRHLDEEQRIARPTWGKANETDLTDLDVYKATIKQLAASGGSQEDFDELAETRAMQMTFAVQQIRSGQIDDIDRYIASNRDTETGFAVRWNRLVNSTAIGVSQVLSAGHDLLGNEELARIYAIEVPKSADLAVGENDFLDYALNTFGQTMPYMAMIAAGQLVTGGVAGAMALGPAATTALLSSVAFGVSYTIEGNQAYYAALERGESKETANAIRHWTGGISGMIEALPLPGGAARYFKKTATKKMVGKLRYMTNLTARKIRDAGIEALQEGSQEINAILQDYIHSGYLPRTPDGEVDWGLLKDQTERAAMGGLLVGGGMAIGATAFENPTANLRLADKLGNIAKQSGFLPETIGQAWEETAKEAAAHGYTSDTPEGQKILSALFNEKIEKYRVLNELLNIDSAQSIMKGSVTEDLGDGKFKITLPDDTKITIIPNENLDTEKDIKAIAKQRGITEEEAKEAEVHGSLTQTGPNEYTSEYNPKIADRTTVLHEATHAYISSGLPATDAERIKKLADVVKTGTLEADEYIAEQIEGRAKERQTGFLGGVTQSLGDILSGIETAARGEKARLGSQLRAGLRKIEKGVGARTTLFGPKPVSSEVRPGPLEPMEPSREFDAVIEADSKTLSLEQTQYKVVPQKISDSAARNVGFGYQSEFDPSVGMLELDTDNVVYVSDVKEFANEPLVYLDENSVYINRPKAEEWFASNFNRANPTPLNIEGTEYNANYPEVLLSKEHAIDFIAQVALRHQGIQPAEMLLQEFQKFAGTVKSNVASTAKTAPVKPGKDIGTLPMYYKMPPQAVRKGLRDLYPQGTTTANLMAAGHRTATTRRRFADVGDTFTVGGQNYIITAVEKIDLKSAEGKAQWSAREGWDVDYSMKDVPRQVYHGAIQTVFRKTDAPAAQKVTPKEYTFLPRSKYADYRAEILPLDVQTESPLVNMSPEQEELWSLLKEQILSEQPAREREVANRKIRAAREAEETGGLPESYTEDIVDPIESYLRLDSLDADTITTLRDEISDEIRAVVAPGKPLTKAIMLTGATTSHGFKQLGVTATNRILALPRDTVIHIGDEPSGADRAFQDLLKANGFTNVTVHYNQVRHATLQKKPRYNAGFKSQKTEGSYTDRDATMLRLSTEVIGSEQLGPSSSRYVKDQNKQISPEDAALNESIIAAATNDVIKTITDEMGTNLWPVIEEYIRKPDWVIAATSSATKTDTFRFVGRDSGLIRKDISKTKAQLEQELAGQKYTVAITGPGLTYKTDSISQSATQDKLNRLEKELNVAIESEASMRINSKTDSSVLFDKEFTDKYLAIKSEVLDNVKDRAALAAEARYNYAKISIQGSAFGTFAPSKDQLARAVARGEVRPGERQDLLHRTKMKPLAGGGVKYAKPVRAMVQFLESKFAGEGALPTGEIRNTLKHLRTRYSRLNDLKKQISKLEKFAAHRRPYSQLSSPSKNRQGRLEGKISRAEAVKSRKLFAGQQAEIRVAAEDISSENFDVNILPTQKAAFLGSKAINNYNPDGWSFEKSLKGASALNLAEIVMQRMSREMMNEQEETGRFASNVNISLKWINATDQEARVVESTVRTIYNKVLQKWKADNDTEMLTSSTMTLPAGMTQEQAQQAKAIGLEIEKTAIAANGVFETDAELLLERSESVDAAINSVWSIIDKHNIDLENGESIMDTTSGVKARVAENIQALPTESIKTLTSLISSDKIDKADARYQALMKLILSREGQSFRKGPMYKVVLPDSAGNVWKAHIGGKNVGELKLQVHHVNARIDVLKKLFPEPINSFDKAVKYLLNKTSGLPYVPFSKTDSDLYKDWSAAMLVWINNQAKPSSLDYVDDLRETYETAEGRRKDIIDRVLRVIDDGKVAEIDASKPGDGSVGGTLKETYKKHIAPFGIEVTDRAIEAKMFKGDPRLYKYYASHIWLTDQKRLEHKPFNVFSARTKHLVYKGGLIEGLALGGELRSIDFIDASEYGLGQLQNATTNRIMFQEAVDTHLFERIDDAPFAGYAPLEHPELEGWSAPASFAKSFNNAFRTSRFRKNEYFNEFMRWNAIFKANKLMFTLFHQWAFLRSFILAGPITYGRTKDFKDAQKAGYDALMSLNPEVVELVRMGATFGRVQDYDPTLLQEKTFVGRFLGKHQDKSKVAAMTGFINKARLAEKNYRNYLFGMYGSSLKVSMALAEVKKQFNLNQKELLEGTITADQIRENVGLYANGDFGGWNNERQGTSPEQQDIMSMLFLGPDWTKTNAIMAYTALRTGKTVQDKHLISLHREVWRRIAVRGLIMTFVLNMLLSAIDDDTAWERFKKAWKHGYFKWLEVDISPIYQILDGDENVDVYGTIFGHLLDPFKFALHPPKTLVHKASPFVKAGVEAVTGENYRGEHFTSILDLPGQGTVAYDSKNKGPVDLSEIPSWAFSSLYNQAPVPARGLVGVLTGEMAAMDALSQTAGTPVQKAKTIKGKTPDE